MHLAALVLVVMVTSQAEAHGMLIWEMLPRHEKMGQVMYTLMRLVDQTCSYSYMPDCHHVLALHGLTNLVNLDEYTLNRLDPHQARSRQVIWGQLMRGGFDLPPAYLPDYYLGIEVNEMTNEIDNGQSSHPHHPQYQPASPAFLFPYPPIPNAYNIPQRAVSNPHPYAVKVTPPRGFSPSKEVGKKGSEEVGKTTDVRHDNGGRTGDKQEVDRFVIHLDNEEPGNAPRAPNDRFSTWHTTDNGQQQQQTTVEDLNSNSESASEEETESARTVEASTVESGSYETVEGKQTEETDRFAGWMDSEKGMDDYYDGLKTSSAPAGIRPSANYEPIMVESRYVESRLPPPTVSHVSPLSQTAPSSSSSSSSSSFVRVEEGRKRSNVVSRPSLLIPLPLLRQ